MIYNSFGERVTIKRFAVLSDLKKPDKRDRAAIRAGSYVIVDVNGFACGERVYHLADLKADGGSLEIADAIRKVSSP